LYSQNNITANDDPLVIFFNCAGILIGSLTAELGGIVNIRCEKTGYNADIEFKLKVRFFLSVVDRLPSVQ